MVRHGGSSADSYLADPTSPISSHSASIVVTSTLRVNCTADRVIDYLNSITFLFTLDFLRARNSPQKTTTKTVEVCHVGPPHGQKNYSDCAGHIAN